MNNSVWCCPLFCFLCSILFTDPVLFRFQRSFSKKGNILHPSPRYRTRHLSRGFYLGRKMPPSSVGVAKLRKVGNGGVGGGSEGDRIRAAPTSLNLRPAFALPFSFSTLADIRKCRNYSRGEQRINHDLSCSMSASSRNVDLFVSSSNGISTYSERQRWICR